MSKKALNQAPVKKGDLVSLSITDISEEGLGIGKYEGFTLFVKDAVTGDQVQAQVMTVKKGFGFARLTELVEASEHRISPRCGVARPCGGCQLQAMSYEAQLDFKTDKVKNHLARLGQVTDLDVKPCLGMEEPWYFRNKAQYPVQMGKDSQLKIGFYAGRTHSIIEADACYIGQPENEIILKLIRQWMLDFKLKPYDEEKGSGLVRTIMIRNGYFTGEVMVCIVIRRQDKKQNAAYEALVQRLTALDLGKAKVTSICLNVNPDKTNVILGDRMVNLYGPGYITDKIGPLTFEISAQSFFQINPMQTRVLYEKALEYAGLTGRETVWDLYCGAGTISLFLAQKAKQVYGVEIVAPAIDNARVNAKRNGIENATFYVGEAEEVLPRLYAEEGIYADVIVVDPPRKGCDERALKTMTEMKPEKIVYVSCNSATLARDLRYLVDHGYQVEKVQPVDMFPQTTHVETVVLMSKVK